MSYRLKRIYNFCIDLVEIIFVIAFWIILLAIISLAIYGVSKINWVAEEKNCIEYSHWIVSNVPARCLSYFQNGPDVPYFRNDMEKFDQYPKDDMDYGQLNLEN